MNCNSKNLKNKHFIKTAFVSKIKVFMSILLLYFSMSISTFAK